MVETGKINIRSSDSEDMAPTDMPTRVATTRFLRCEGNLDPVKGEESQNVDFTVLDRVAAWYIGPTSEYKAGSYCQFEALSSQASTTRSVDLVCAIGGVDTSCAK